MIDDIKAYVRDINLGLIVNDSNITRNINNRSDSLQFLKKNYKLIKYVTKMGGVLVGSRAIRCYSINSEQILNRPSNDWDFIITRDMAFDICDKFGITYDLSDFISIEKHAWTLRRSYSPSVKVGVVNVHLIIKDLPEYTEDNGVRVVGLSYSINQKVKMLEELINNRTKIRVIQDDNSKEEIKKHREDLLRIISKFNK